MAKCQREKSGGHRRAKILVCQQEDWHLTLPVSKLCCVGRSKNMSGRPGREGSGCSNTEMRRKVVQIQSDGNKRGVIRAQISCWCLVALWFAPYCRPAWMPSQRDYRRHWLEVYDMSAHIIFYIYDPTQSMTHYFPCTMVGRGPNNSCQ